MTTGNQAGKYKIKQEIRKSGIKLEILHDFEISYIPVAIREL